MLTQAESATTTIRSAPAPRPSVAPQFFIVVRHPNGDYIPERDILDLGRDATISDIAAGLYAGVARVIGINEASGKTWDASQEIATEVLNQALDLYEFEAMPIEVRDFLEDILGCHYVRAAGIEAAA